MHLIEIHVYPSSPHMEPKHHIFLIYVNSFYVCIVFNKSYITLICSINATFSKDVVYRTSLIG